MILYHLKERSQIKSGMTKNMTLIKNSKAFHDYEILDTFEAGMVLTGSEVKSLRNKNGNLSGSFVKVYNGKVVLENMHIGIYKPAGPEQHEPDRNRLLLLHKKQIEKLVQASDEDGKTIIPLEVYTSEKLIKAKIAIAKGKKKYEKRATLKKRDIEREIDRKMKR